MTTLQMAERTGVNEYGHITNQTLWRLFDLNVYQARDLLRDMQTRQLLTKIDDKTAH